MAERRRRRSSRHETAVAALVVLAAGVGAIASVRIYKVHAELVTIDGPAHATTGAVRVRPPSPTIGGCSIFPPDNPWNQDVSSAPVRADSAAMIARIQAIGSDNLHPDFGENQSYGIPFVVVPPDQPRVPITYDAYGDESDPGPFPIPLDAPVEGGGLGGDRHVIALQQGSCELFELFVGRRQGAGWLAASGARWDLNTGALRPLTWTSADAAGLPILPGLVRYDEVAAGAIRHAIRVTFSQTRKGFILPATHYASSRTDPDLPAMGQRFRLRADYDTSRFTGQAKVIVEALKTYGFIVADNGSNWFFQGATDPRWDDDDLNQLKSVPGTAFEALDTGPVRTS